MFMFMDTEDTTENTRQSCGNSECWNQQFQQDPKFADEDFRIYAKKFQIFYDNLFCKYVDTHAAYCMYKILSLNIKYVFKTKAQNRRHFFTAHSVTSFFSSRKTHKRKTPQQACRNPGRLEYRILAKFILALDFGHLIILSANMHKLSANMSKIVCKCRILLEF